MHSARLALIQAYLIFSGMQKQSLPQSFPCISNYRKRMLNVYSFLQAAGALGHPICILGSPWVQRASFVGFRAVSSQNIPITQDSVLDITCIPANTRIYTAKSPYPDLHQYEGSTKYLPFWMILLICHTFGIQKKTNPNTLKHMCHMGICHTAK